MYSLFQRILAFISILILSPLLLLISLLIVLEDKHSAFFLQRRIGKNGKSFNIIKFRTMTVSPEASAGQFDAGNRSRVTKVGKKLRHSKLDELPQLFNVILGDMALVGPRPEVEIWVKSYPDDWKIIHTVKPGITDPASIEFRNEEQLLSESCDPQSFYKNSILPRKLKLYKDYVKHRTIFLDLRIIIRTFLIVISK